MKRKLYRETKDIILIVLGIFAAGMGLKGFLLSSHFIDGGVTGVSMLLSDVTGVSLAVLIPLINLPFLLLGYKQIGGKFALKSAIAILGLALCLFFVHYPDITADKVLTAIFGGFFIGGGIGLAVRGGAVLDGTEIAALLISKRSYSLKIGDIILILNIFIFAAATFFLGVDPALYSMLTYFAASKTVDFLVYGIEEAHGIFIVSPKSLVIHQALMMTLNRGTTILRGQRGLTDIEQDTLYCIVTRLEIPKVRSIIDSIDSNAFVVVHHVAESSGVSGKKGLVH